MLDKILLLILIGTIIACFVAKDTDYDLFERAPAPEKQSHYYDTKRLALVADAAAYIQNDDWAIERRQHAAVDKSGERYVGK